MRRVIVHADDFGLHPSINRAIALGHEQGVISSCSLLVDGDAAPEAAHIARTLPGLDVGLHFTLTGMNGGLSRFVWGVLRGSMRASDMERELRRQLKAARDFGLTVSHIDSHQHLHALPFVMETVCRVAKQHGIRCVRVPEDGASFTSAPLARRAQSVVLRVCARLSRRIVARHGLQTTDHFSGMAMSGHLTGPILARYIENAKPGTTEIVVHPGTNDDALAGQFAWGYDWEGELRAVQSDEARAALAGINLVGWRDL